MCNSDYSKKDIATFVLHSINDSQNTIKNTDVKGQVLIGILGLSLANTNKILSFQVGTQLFILFASLSILAAILVLIPAIKSNDEKGNNYFISKLMDPNKLTELAIECDWIQEGYSVLVNLAKIRDQKIFRLQFSFLFCALAFVTVLIDSACKLLS